MCGILGTINIDFNKNSLDLIKHRGPDDFGIEVINLGDNIVRFGQRRLSIIDLSSAGHQPMISNCNNYVLVFNGEIYNHLDLRKKLSNQIKYRGYSDSETLLNYLIKFGTDGLEDLNGIFAFAFLNKLKEELVLVRDPFGVKPLYIFENNNSLAFSSEIRPIKGMIDKNEIDMNAMASLLKLRYNPSPDTLISGLKKVKPGSFIKINLKRKLILKSFNYGIKGVKKKYNLNFNTALKKYQQKFENAVKRQLLSDVQVGVMLSGGIDSAMVAYYAKKHYQGNLKAFTIGFEGLHDEDEIKNAKLTAEFLQIDHYIKKINFSDFLDLIEECTRIVEEPLATTSIIPMYYLSELTSNHVKVVLTGQGADEPLGGYMRYKSELIKDKFPDSLNQIISPIIKLSKIKNEQILRGAKTINIKNKIERFIKTYEVFSDSEINSLIGFKDNRSEERILSILENFDSKEYSNAEQMMAIDSRLNLSDDLLNYTDKITMNFSIECRVPILDLELVKFIEEIPENYKLNLFNSKIIHRKLARKILPKEIVNRPKKGFQSPTRIWFNKYMPKVEKILLDKNSSFSKVFNSKKIRVILNQHKQGYNKEKQIFLLLSLYFWIKNNFNE